MPPLLTIGHGTLDRSGLASQLQAAGVELVVDVRRFPGSRRNPDVSRDALPTWLPEEGVGYRWAEDLGGRRRTTDPDGSPDSWWQVEAFRAYAGYTRTPEFRVALDELLGEAARQRTAILCSETVWWRCHRRVISDVVVLGRGVDVRHIMPGGRLVEHRPSAGARPDPDGDVVWDGPA
jgi:uncharacterized protein (DUF488 family)